MKQGRSLIADDIAAELAADIAPLHIDEQHLQRIRRIGRGLLKVANCFVTFGSVAEKKSGGEKSMASIEAQFCDSLPLSGIAEYVADAKIDRTLESHRHVVGAPYIRFYASCPIRSEDNTVVGNVRVIDYSPRTMTEEDKQKLSDIAALVERELRLNAITVTRQDLLKKNWSLRRDLMIDPVTGTWNRTAIMRLLKQEIEQCRREDKHLSLVMADLDGFKAVNDAHGRSAGDTLLVKMASRLRSCIRPQDTLGRFEGGRFLILLPGADNKVARMVAERLHHAIKSNAETLGNVKVDVTICSGTVSTNQFPSASHDDLGSLASAALSSAKKMGHNSIVQAVPDGMET